MTKSLSILATCAATLCFATASQAQDRALILAAKTTLAKVQGNSFAANREYCGLLGINSNGQIVATRARKGRADSCTPRDFPSNDIETIASYHTHGAYDPDADAEVPSLSDIDADTDEDLDYGFISTPGGRFWLIDTRKQEVRMLCNLGCMPSDRDFVQGDWGPIKKRYSRNSLLRRENTL